MSDNWESYKYDEYTDISFFPHPSLSISHAINLMLQRVVLPVKQIQRFHVYWSTWLEYVVCRQYSVESIIQPLR